MGFKRLQSDADSEFSFLKAENTTSTTEWGQMGGPMIQEAISVKHEV